jgi:hypothetical protein
LLKFVDSRLPVADFGAFRQIIATGLKITNISNAVGIDIGLVRVSDGRTIVDISANAIVVLIVCRIIETGVAGIATSIRVRIALVGVANRGTIVHRRRDPVSVHIRSVASRKIETLISALLGHRSRAPGSRPLIFKVGK